VWSFTCSPPPNLHAVVLRHKDDFTFVFSITTHICRKRYETDKWFTQSVSWWLTPDDNSVLWMLHCVDVGNVPNALEIHAASIFRVKVCNVGEFYVYLETPQLNITSN
jgi:hypothetical protein